MAGSQAKPPMEREIKIGSTTYVVTSHFKEQGSTAVDKIKRLIDYDTKNNTCIKKVDF